jgi:DNA-binding response OmpR family regulator
MLQGVIGARLPALGAMEPNAPTILIVEDHCATRRFLADNLAADGYEPLEADSASAGRRLIVSRTPDLAIVDLGLPDRDGLELLREVRSTGDPLSGLDPLLPVLILSGRASELDRIRGFERGADDYLVKPFSYGELRGRLAALLRRSGVRSPQRRLRVGPLELDPLTRSVWVEGEGLQLANKEFALLFALASEPTRVFTREELLTGVWGYRALGTTRTLDTHASRLRQKLRARGLGFVVNVWGVGYRLLDARIGE